MLSIPTIKVLIKLRVSGLTRPRQQVLGNSVIAAYGLYTTIDAKIKQQEWPGGAGGGRGGGEGERRWVRAAKEKAWCDLLARPFALYVRA